MNVSSSFLSSAPTDLQVPSPYVPVSSSDLQSSQPHGGYLPARRVPRDLSERSKIHIEEQYYAPAVSLLISLLTSTARPTANELAPVLVPSPEQIAVIATLAIHPQTTSRIRDPKQHDIHNLSISYLRSLLATAGPVNADLRKAFVFQDVRRRARLATPSPESGISDDEIRINGKMANNESIWHRGSDFFKVLGWAFNCSAHYPHRWRWWRVWLEFVMDVLENDYDERKRLAGEESEQNADASILHEALVLEYSRAGSNRVSPVKEIMAALFATGSTSDMAIFPEVFKNELYVPKANHRKRKREALDLENGQFGDYDEDSSSESEHETQAKTSKAIKKTEAMPSWSESCLKETVNLRLRIFRLLSRVSWDLPKISNIRADVLYSRFEEGIRQLPLDAFSMVMYCNPPILSVPATLSLLNQIIHAYLPSAAPDPSKVDKDTASSEGISAIILERCYLPFAAMATMDINARLSLVLEVLMRILWMADGLRYSEELKKAVQTGVDARMARIKKKRGAQADDGAEQDAKDVLRRSGDRLLAMLEAIRSEVQG